MRWKKRGKSTRGGGGKGDQSRGSIVCRERERGGGGGGGGGPTMGLMEQECGGCRREERVFVFDAEEKNPISPM